MDWILNTIYLCTILMEPFDDWYSSIEMSSQAIAAQWNKIYLLYIYQLHRNGNGKYKSILIWCILAFHVRLQTGAREVIKRKCTAKRCTSWLKKNSSLFPSLSFALHFSFQISNETWKMEMHLRTQTLKRNFFDSFCWRGCSRSQQTENKW